MLEKYGLQSSVASGNYNIAREPLYFVRSGDVNLNRGSVRSSGLDARGWSRTGVGYASATSATAYHLNAKASDVYPSYGPRNRWTGFPVRCLV